MAQTNNTDNSTTTTTTSATWRQPVGATAKVPGNRQLTDTQREAAIERIFAALCDRLGITDNEAAKAWVGAALWNGQTRWDLLSDNEVIRQVSPLLLGL